MTRRGWFRIGVVGISARAAVQSLARVGCSAWAIDLFADADLQRLATVRRCPTQDYPHALLQLATHFPSSPFLYTGGLENHPQIIAGLMAIHELWGNCPETVQAVRDPWQLALRFPDGFAPVLPRNQACPSSGQWLCKPLRSGGGTSIRLAQAGEIPDDQHYLQKYIEGISASAVCLDDRCLGVTQQLLGRSWLHTQGFCWCGNVGPWTDDSEVLTLCERWCRKFQNAFGLQGIWGFDFIRHREGIYIVEINPRYPASVEVLEHAFSTALLSGDVLPAMTPRCYIAKAIYYAPFDLRFPSTGPWLSDLEAATNPWHCPTYADIPTPETDIPKNRPVLTLFAQGPTPAACVAHVQQLAAQLDRLFTRTNASAPSPLRHSTASTFGEKRPCTSHKPKSRTEAPSRTCDSRTPRAHSPGLDTEEEQL
jgi:predicted ATP-grasp superfamily ATP-dependent carboligase